MKDQQQTSRFLSLVLRHQPEAAGITLDEAGWVETDRLLAGLASVGRPLTREQLQRLVKESDKQRFALSPDGAKIRANQGHSLPVDLQLSPGIPPATLYHGTSQRFLEAIKTEGLKPQKRHHVHLSTDRHSAFKVGQRRGKAVVLAVDTGAMTRAGHVFFVSNNGVWLTDSVPPDFLRPLQD